MGFLNFLRGQSYLEQIDKSEEPDFVDLQFTITKFWQDNLKNHICEVKGLWGEKIVCFQIAIRPDMYPGIIEGEVDKTRFYRNGVAFYSVGKLSDTFINALIHLYKFDYQKEKMNDITNATAFILSGNSQNFLTDYVKIKIFLDDNDEKGFYSEWYVNIDVKNKILELREKDSEYRLNIINNLTK
jgi:hypothetical protein